MALLSFSWRCSPSWIRHPEPTQAQDGQRQPSYFNNGRDIPRYQDQRQSDQGTRGQVDRYGNAQRPYRDQLQPDQGDREPAYNPGVGTARRNSVPPSYPPSRY